MYYPNYNPSVNDVYLYGPANTGLPIGLNPNCLIYGASADYRSISVRSRAFTVTGGTPIPPGTTAAYLPNYYNIGGPLFTAISTQTICSAIHFSANKSSDSTGEYAKYTGTTTAFPTGSLSFWNNTYTGFSSYGPWTGIYNCVPLNQITGATSYSGAVYFAGSPEIPGFGSGGTYYNIFPSDIGMMDFLLPGNTLPVEPIKKVNPYYGITNIINGISAYADVADIQANGGIQYAIPVEDFYFWDGNDKIIPVDYIKIKFSIATNPLINDSISLYFSAPSSTVATNMVWGGDSSGQFIYYKNNKIYFIGFASTSTGPTIINGQYYAGVSGSLYCDSKLPLYNFLLQRPIDKNHYWYAHSDGATLATQIDFTRLLNLNNQVLTTLNTLYTEISN